MRAMGGMGRAGIFADSAGLEIEDLHLRALAQGYRLLERYYPSAGNAVAVAKSRLLRSR